MKKTEFKFPVRVGCRIYCRHCGQFHNEYKEATTNKELISILDEFRLRGQYSLSLEFNSNLPF